MSYLWPYIEVHPVAVRRALALLIGVCLASCTQPVKVWDAHLWGSGLPLPVNRRDFPTNDIASRSAAADIVPTTIGSALLRYLLANHSEIRDLVVRQGVPDGVLPTHGRHVELYYLDEDRTYVFAANLAGRLTLAETKALAGADRAALNQEAHRERAARELREYLDQLARVSTVGRAVLRTVPAHDPPGRDPGFIVVENDPPSRKLFGLGDDTRGVVVGLVYDNGAAAGLISAGDVISAVGGRPVSTLDEYQPDSEAASLELTIGTTAPRTVTILPETVPLAFAVTVIKTPISNALVADGRIYVTTGLLALVQNDDELAVAIGHELAHLAEGHDRLTMTKVANRVLAIGLLVPTIAVPVAGPLMAQAVLATQMRFNRDQERVADRRGLEYAARAGYDPRAAVPFLERLQADWRATQLQSFFDVHPPFPERIEEARKTAEILAPQ